MAFWDHHKLTACDLSDSCALHRAARSTILTFFRKRLMNFIAKKKKKKKKVSLENHPEPVASMFAASAPTVADIVDLSVTDVFSE